MVLAGHVARLCDCCVAALVKLCLTKTFEVSLRAASGETYTVHPRSARPTNRSSPR